MVTDQDIEDRLKEIGFRSEKMRPTVLLYLKRGDVVTVAPRPDGWQHVGGYPKEKCRPLPELFPEAFAS